VNSNCARQHSTIARFMNARSDTAPRNMATNLVTVELRIAARRRQQPSRHIYVTGRARHQQR
jgi:hypothetical protein